MTAKTPPKLTVTTIRELIEDCRWGRVNFRRVLPALYAACFQAIFDDHLPDGRRKYRDDTRETFPFTEHAFWSWREMLTPHDFETLNGETVVMSEVSA